MAFISHEVGHGSGRRHSANLAAITLAVLGLALVAGGVSRLAGLPWGEVATSLAAHTWPVAEARIVSTSLDEIRVPGKHGLASELALTVEYEFDTAHGTVTAKGGSLYDRSSLDDRRLLSLYRRTEFARVMDRTMPVSYDPAAPTRAFLDMSLPWVGMLPRLAVGAMLIFLGGSWLARAARLLSGIVPRN